MKIAVLMPTYGRPRLVENAIGLFRMQSYHDRARLYVYDDGGQLPSTLAEDFIIATSTIRAKSIVAKYDVLAELAINDGATHFAILDDDDIFLPNHLEACAKAIENWPQSGWAKPAQVFSTYSDDPAHPRLQRESAIGRFWASLLITVPAWKKAGGFVDTDRADFDQLFLSRCTSQLGPAAIPLEESFCFRWHDTWHYHSQGFITHPEDTEWYRRIGNSPLAAPLKPHPVLTPGVDAGTLATMRAIAETYKADKFGPLPESFWPAWVRTF